jgi:hypothetical protein
MRTFGTIAAADMPAGEANTQVNPRLAHFFALFAATRIWCLIDIDGCEVLAGH